jgi:hypothetical protein
MIKHTYRICGCRGICGVSIHRHLGYLFVVLTELRTNPGLSVTNCYEDLATDIARGLVECRAIEDATLIQWIEHYEPDSRRAPPFAAETWDRVTMDWDGSRFAYPRWKPLRNRLLLWLLLRRRIEPHALVTSSSVSRGVRALARDD